MSTEASKTARPPRQPLEMAAAIHVGIYLVLATWVFGGNSPAGRMLVTWWGILGIVLTATAAANGTLRRRGHLRPLRWLWPLGLFNLLVVAGTFQPSFRLTSMDGVQLLMPIDVGTSLPSSAQPTLAREALWLFDGIYLSCFNLALLVRSRRTLRMLLLAAAANALVLAVLGSLQKLAGSTGLYFGAVQSPQKFFFSTFVYHNHWGAFAILMTALSIGLVARYANRGEYRSFWSSPAFGGLVAVFFLAAAIPLSTSRSSTLLVIALLAGAGIHGVFRTVRRRRSLGLSPAPPLAIAALGAIAAAGAVYVIAGDTIRQRIAKTREQVAVMHEQGTIGSRAVLYRDTWHMAQDRLLFGWGMASYPTVFYIYNTQEPKGDRLPVFYNDAHSDWLQAVAEHGLVGATLLGLLAIVPLCSLRLRHLASPLPWYLLAGCTLLLLYAWIEFPFGNPAVVLSWWLCFFSAIRYARLASPTEAVAGE